MNTRHIIRPTILVLTGAWALGVFSWTRSTFPSPDLQIIRLVQAYALTAFSLVYLALLISPLTMMWTNMPGRLLVIHARRAIGVSAWAFAVLHASFAFFKLLGGFVGWSFLSQSFQTAVLIGLFNLVVLSVMAATSFDVIMRRLGRRWKMIHRLLYVVGMLIMVHALMLGTHFMDLSTLIPRISILLVSILFFLEAWRLDRWVRKPEQQPAAVGWPMVVLSLVIGYGFASLLGSHDAKLSIHTGHNAANPKTASVTPGGARVNVQLDKPEDIKTGQSASLIFRMSDPATGAPVRAFATLFEKRMHLIFMRDDFEHFAHVHPDLQSDGSFTLQHVFTEPGSYHGYANFHSLGGSEQQFAFTLTVNGQLTATPTMSEQLTVQNGIIQAVLRPSTRSPAAFTTGQGRLAITLTDTTTHQPLTAIEPYLGAFGHLTMVNAKDYSFVHVHPNSLRAPDISERAGPTIEFLPMGLSGPIRAGKYTVFAEFNIGGQVRVFRFVIVLE